MSVPNADMISGRPSSR